MTLQNIIFTVSQIKAVGSSCVAGIWIGGARFGTTGAFLNLFNKHLGELANPACFVFIEWYIHRWYNKVVKRTFK